MRPKTRKSQNIRIMLPVNQQQVWLDVTLAITTPITAQFMVAVPWLQRLIVCQGHQNGH